ncbi:MAG TPA: crosslink repair DNA glycosylase YcaQ family protein, partial [Vicinamibacterales bacterium]|nr:crosslink repair DNA glycosylase YcaQ family protein [Vicinamibacterales bacterium]
MADAKALSTLRAQAVAQTLFSPTHLADAIDRLGFVQADPIRSPARAQDLILRQRVRGYRAGDLERQYASLAVEEDYLYAYGFLSKRVWHLLHPRKTPPLRAFEKKVLETVTNLGEAHPRALEAHLGKRRVVNAWGGYSKATTHALEWLHWRGLLRVTRRENGIRVYKPPSVRAAEVQPAERLRALIMVYAHIFAPAPEKSLQSAIARHRELGNTRRLLTEMISDGALRRDIVSGVSYVSPATASRTGDAPPVVRFLAPFDPVVWDRTRFEHLWGWAYRFEAYTPIKKRVRGYYALPLLWRDTFAGWANASVA